MDFDISDLEQLESYLMNNIWHTALFEDIPDTLYRQRIYIRLNDDLTFWTAADYDKNDSFYSNRLENINVLGQWKIAETNIEYHDEDKKKPYLRAEDGNLDFIEIAEDYYTLQNCQSNSCETTTYYKNEKERVDFDGTYIFNGKTLVIQGEDLYHIEADKHYMIHQRDNARLTINGQIISEISSYRFWIDEKENIILLSDGLDLYGVDEEIIKADYPFYILTRQK